MLEQICNSFNKKYVLSGPLAIQVYRRARAAGDPKIAKSSLFSSLGLSWDSLGRFCNSFGLFLSSLGALLDNLVDFGVILVSFSSLWTFKSNDST